MPWLPSNSRAISRPPEIPWTPESGISLPRNVSVAPIGKPKRRKAPRGSAPPSLRKFRRCPNANLARKQRRFPLNWKPLPSMPANRLRELLQSNLRRPAPLVELPDLVADAAAVAVRVHLRAAPKAPRIAESCLPLLLHRFRPLLQRKSKRQAALLTPAWKSRSPKPQRLRSVAARVIPAYHRASRNWK